MSVVSAVVVHRRDPELLAACLRSLQTALERPVPGAQIVVADNGSSDGSRELVRRDFPDVRLLELGSNRGFAAAFNAGVRATSGEWVLSMNDDATPAGDAVERLLETARSGSDVMAVAAQLRFASDPRVVNSAGIAVDRLGIAADRLVGTAADGGPGTPVEVFGASAGAALYRRFALDQLGGLDEDFNAYLDDVDLAWRGRMRGWRAIYEPRAVVIHHHSATTGQGSPFKHYLVGRNRIRLLAKNMDGRELRRRLPAIVAYELCYVTYACMADRTLAPIRGRLAGLRQWSALRHAYAASRRPVALEPPGGLRAALARRRAWRRWSATVVALLALLVLAGPAGAAASYPSGFVEQTVVSGLDSPTGFAYAPDGRVLIAEKQGQVEIAQPGSDQATQALDIRDQVNQADDKGLLGIAVDTDFASNHYVYLLYTYELKPMTPDQSGAMVSRLERYVLGADNKLSLDATLLGSYVSGPCPAARNDLDCIPSESRTHSIGSVRADPDGTLWVSSGDGADDLTVDPLAFRSYDEKSYAGKILHIDRNGRGLPGHASCPTDADLTHVCTKVYASGFRNPFRFNLRPGGGVVVGDVGWTKTEEVDVIRQAGKSYGWPCYEGSGHTAGYKDSDQCPPEYAKEGTAAAQVGPDYEYAHCPATPCEAGDAALGGPTYTGDQYPAGYRNAAFVGDYGRRILTRMVFDGNDKVSSVQPFASNWDGLDVQPGPGGDLYYVGHGDFQAGQGALRRIVYTPGNQSPTASFDATPPGGDGAPLTVAFNGSASNDPDGDTVGYSWDFGDGSPRVTSATPSHQYMHRGSYLARLTVDDGRGLSNTKSLRIDVGKPPTLAVSSPPSYVGGQDLHFTASGKDQSGQDLPSGAFDWRVRIIHIDHIHPYRSFAGTATPVFPGPTDHDADSHLELQATATDGDGIQTTKTVDVYPKTARFALESSPSGAEVSYAGRSAFTPFATTSAVGFAPAVTAAASFRRDGRDYHFVRWSDGGARVHNISVQTQGATLTATYSVAPLAPGAGAKTDRSGPSITFSARGFDARRGILSGRVEDAGGVQLMEVAVGRAGSVTLARRRRSGCRWWLTRKRRLSRSLGSCGQPEWIRARLSRRLGRTEWRVSLKRRRVPSGAYRVVLRAADRSGNVAQRLVRVRVGPRRR